MPTFHDFQVKTIQGNDQSLDVYKGKVVLAVNVASKCGLTPQYQGLEALHQKYKDKGFTVLGLPCNQFAFQEPGTEEEIQNFCSTKYQVTFPMTSKIKVNGNNKHPLYKWLTDDAASFPGKISWNFEKFLIGKDGQVLERFNPKVTPEDNELNEAIEAAIA